MCPVCGGFSELAAEAASSQKLSSSKYVYSDVVVEGFLDNIRSAYNVGAIFRTADGAGIKHLHLAGITPTPFHPKVRKTALGSEKVIPWTHHHNGLEAIADIKSRGFEIIALERSPVERSLFEYTRDNGAKTPIILIVGNELSGVDQGILDICDRILALPMVGSKSSLNVEVSFSIAAYYLRFNIC